jgi:hypothetical protein
MPKIDIFRTFEPIGSSASPWERLEMRRLVWQLSRGDKIFTFPERMETPEGYAPGLLSIEVDGRRVSLEELKDILAGTPLHQTVTLESIEADLKLRS